MTTTENHSLLNQTPFERSHRSYEKLKALFQEHIEHPIDIVVIVEEERPGCTSSTAEGVAIYYHEFIMPATREDRRPDFLVELEQTRPGVVSERAELELLAFLERPT